jgi:hypothetical protein
MPNTPRPCRRNGFRGSFDLAKEKADASSVKNLCFNVQWFARGWTFVQEQQRDFDKLRDRAEKDGRLWVGRLVVAPSPGRRQLGSVLRCDRRAFAAVRSRALAG